MTTENMTDRFDNVRKRFEMRLDALSADIQLFEARLNDMTEEARARAEMELDELRANRERFRGRLAKARDAASDAAADLENGLDKAWDDVTAALNKARNRFKD